MVGCLLILGLALPVGEQGPDGQTVTLFAAASAREVLQQVARTFEKQTGSKVVINAGPSSELARQIERGAGADLFLSADEAWADYLAEKNLVELRRDLLTNRLVVVVPADSSVRLHDLRDLAQPAIRRLALAGEVVPAGRYAREALQHGGVWDQVRGRIVEGGDVRATLVYVARGEAEAGLVYATDVTGEARVHIAFTVDSQLHRPIRYPLVLVKRQPIRDEARRFYDFLLSDSSARVFQAWAGGAEVESQTEPEVILGLTREDWRAVWLSVRVAGLAVLLSLPFGISLGWLLARKAFPGKTLVETAVNLPLVLPPVVTGYLLLILLGKQGWLGSRLDRWFGVEIALTWRAAVLAVAVMGFPLLVRAIRLAFQGIDPRLFQAARSLGAGPVDAFLSVSLPLARGGVIAGVILAFARGLGEFGATLMFAGNLPQTRTLAIQLYALGSLPGEAAEERMWRLVAASVVLAFAALAASEYLERRGQRRLAA